MEGHYQAVLWSVAVLAVIVIAAIVIFAVLRVRRSAYYSPVRTEMKKQRRWIRRGEYNAAMVKGRQNLEMLLNLVAERNGIVLDNTTQAVNNAKNGQTQSYRWENTGHGRKRVKVMTYQQFGWWLDNKGYLDRVARWELNEIRQIGNRAVHENFSDKDEAVSQYDYLEDLLNIMTEKSPAHQKRSEQSPVTSEREGSQKTSGNVKEEKENSKKQPKEEEKKDRPGKDAKEETARDSSTKQNDSKQSNNKQSNNKRSNNKQSNKQNSSKQSNNKQNTSKQNNTDKQNSSNKQKNTGSSEKKSNGAAVTEIPGTVTEMGAEGQEDPAKAAPAVNKKKRSRKRKPKQQPAEKQPERTDEES